MNTNFTVFRRKARTLSLGRRINYRELGLSTSVENMAQLHPPHVEEAEVVSVHTRIMDPKRFVYQIDLKWSDGTASSSYRSYSDFFDFQCALLVEFPVEGGQGKGSVRTLPFLPGKKIFKKSTYELAQERHPQINEYVKTLLTLPEHVSRSERLLRFFRSNWQEDRMHSDEPLSTERDPTAVSYSVRHLNRRRPVSEYSDDTSPLSIQAGSNSDEMSLRSGSEEQILIGI